MCTFPDEHYSSFSKMNYFAKTEEERAKNIAEIQEHAPFQNINLFKFAAVVFIRQKNSCI